MKKVNRFVPDLPQQMGDRGTEIIERILAAYGVSRASELPEEGKVRLMRELEGYLESDLPEPMRGLTSADLGFRGAMRRFWARITSRRRSANRH